ncbi:MAG: heat-inducible transcriptional repressor HrcA [Candidatus Omnitrophota bacterium]
MPYVDNEQRQRRILGFIVTSYISLGNPVSSRTICRRYRLGLCPATIRNVMADLEEMGLITHPYTSAGRIPTDKGYRFYIDALRQELMPTQEEKDYVVKEFRKIEKELENLLVKTGKLLADMTKYTSMISPPQIEHSRLKRIDLILLDNEKVVVVVVSNAGVVKHTIVKLKIKIEETELRQLVSFLNAELCGVELEKVRRMLMQKFIGERGELAQLIKKGIELISLSTLISTNRHLYMEGTRYLFEQPEFLDVEKTKRLMEIFDTKQQLLEIMQRGAGEIGVKVYIGRENKYEEVKDCTTIIASYRVRDNSVGAVGIIGPKRMDYAKVIPVVEYVAQTFGEILAEIAL